MFILDLCMELGKTQKEIFDPKTGLGRNDIIEWMAYQRIKPFGYDEQRRRHGMICAAIWNSAGKSSKEDVEWVDFFRPSWEEPEETHPDGTSKGKFAPDTLVSILKAVAKPAKKEEDGS